MQRTITSYIQNDLKDKMVFLGGPRQCGKTTLAKQILTTANIQNYLNWDSPTDCKIIKSLAWDEAAKLIVFDELHKFPKWKNWIKGLWDKRGEKQNYLVTGSARLDVYRKGGDSLMGRYHYWRLHPLTIDELAGTMDCKETFDRLMKFGGFPEPFFKASERFSRRWRRERYEKVIKEDIRDLESIRNLNGVELLVELLRTRVGGTIVVSNLAEDLQVSPKTVSHWLDILERMYVIFRIYPYGGKMTRSLQKAAKVFFFDIADVQGDEGARFENLVACALLKRCHFLEDYEGYRMQLHYVRDKEGREVDFAIIKDKQLKWLIEAKCSDVEPSKSLVYFTERMKPEKPSCQLVGKNFESLTRKGIFIAPVYQVLKDLIPWF